MALVYSMISMRMPCLGKLLPAPSSNIDRRNLLATEFGGDFRTLYERLQKVYCGRGCDLGILRISHSVSAICVRFLNSGLRQELDRGIRARMRVPNVEVAEGRTQTAHAAHSATGTAGSGCDTHGHTGPPSSTSGDSENGKLSV